MKTVAYLRVSRDDKTYKGTIETQRAEITRALSARGLAVDTWLDQDDGISGAIPIAERPDGRKLIDAVDRGEVGTLLLYRLDRLGREDYDILTTLAYLRRRGVQVVSINDNLGDDNASGRMQTGVLAVFAGYERGIIRERTMHGKARKAREGGWTGGKPPYGYRAERCSLGGSVGSRLTIDNREKAVILRIYDNLVTHRRSLNAIARDLDASGIRPPRGRSIRWSAATIGYIARNTAYKGEFRFGDDVIIPIDPIISADRWDAAQRQIAINEHRSFSMLRIYDYLLCGSIFCAHCGRAYVGSATTNRGKVYHYYRCNTERASQPCPGRAIRAEDAEARALELVASLIAKPASLIAKRIRAAQPEPHLDAETLLQSLRDREAAVEDHRQNLITFAASGIITPDDLKQQLARLDAQKGALAEEIHAAEAAGADAARLTHAVKTFEASIRHARIIAEIIRPNTLAGLPREAQKEVLAHLGLRFDISTHEKGGATDFSIHATAPVAIQGFGATDSSSRRTYYSANVLVLRLGTFAKAA